VVVAIDADVLQHTLVVELHDASTIARLVADQGSLQFNDARDHCIRSGALCRDICGGN